MSTELTVPDVLDSILGSFYGSTSQRLGRAWTREELLSASRLEAAGWTPARAAFIADWLQDSRDGATWRHFLSKRDGICGVEKSREAIESRSGAEQRAPARPTMAPDPEFDAYWASMPSFACRVAETQAPFKGLIGEAEAAGLNGPALSFYVAKRRGAAMKGKHLPGFPKYQRCDGSPSFTVPMPRSTSGAAVEAALEAAARAAFGLRMPHVERTDEPIEIEFEAVRESDADEFPDVSE